MSYCSGDPHRRYDSCVGAKADDWRLLKHGGCLRRKSAWASEVAEAVVRQIEWISVSPGCTHSMLSPTNYHTDIRVTLQRAAAA